MEMHTAMNTISFETLYGILYLEINLISIFLVVMIRISTLGITRMNAQRHFSMAMDSQAVFFLADTAAMMTVTHLLPPMNWLLLLSKTIYFFSCTLMCYFWMLYFENRWGSKFAHNHRLVMHATVLIWVIGILEIINLFTGILFYVDGSCVYHRGPLFLLQYVIAYFYVFIACGRAFREYFRTSDSEQKRRLKSCFLFPIAPAIAGIIQFIRPQLPLLCAVLSLTALYLYLGWIDTTISVDPLTRLNNRKQLEHQFSQWKKEHHSEDIWLLLIDADKFKQINDTWGHTQGDIALSRIAEAMRQTVRNHSIRTCLCRYGGDEFTILAKTSSEEEIARIRDDLRTTLANLNREAASPFDVSVSIGCAKADENGSLKSLIDAADEKLYEEKKKHNTDDR